MEDTEQQLDEIAEIELSAIWESLVQIRENNCLPLDLSEYLDIIDKRGNVETSTIANERRELVRAAIRKLPEPDASILWMQFIEEKQPRQIAKLTGVEPVEVEFALLRHLGTLRRLLKDYPR